MKIAINMNKQYGNKTSEASMENASYLKMATRLDTLAKNSDKRPSLFPQDTVTISPDAQEKAAITAKEGFRNTVQESLGTETEAEKLVRHNEDDTIIDGSKFKFEKSVFGKAFESTQEVTGSDDGQKRLKAAQEELKKAQQELAEAQAQKAKAATPEEETMADAAVAMAAQKVSMAMAQVNMISGEQAKGLAAV